MRQVLIEQRFQEQIDELRSIIIEQGEYINKLQRGIGELDNRYVTGRNLEEVYNHIGESVGRLVSKDDLKKAFSEFADSTLDLTDILNSRIRDLNRQFMQVVQLREEIGKAIGLHNKKNDKVDRQIRELESLRRIIVKKELFERELDILKKNCATEQQLKSLKKDVERAIRSGKKELEQFKRKISSMKG